MDDLTAPMDALPQSVLPETLSRFCPRELKKRLTAYDRCDKRIRACL